MCALVHPHSWSALVHPPPPQPSPHPATSPLRARASWTAASLAAAPVAAPAAAPAVASLAAAAPVAVAVTAAVSCGDVVFGYVLLSFSHRLGFAAATTGEARRALTHPLLHDYFPNP